MVNIYIGLAEWIQDNLKSKHWTVVVYTNIKNDFKLVDKQTNIWNSYDLSQPHIMPFCSMVDYGWIYTCWNTYNFKAIMKA